MQSLEQRRAHHAWDRSGKGVGKYRKEYVNLAKSLPALIMNSGLMQVMAFLNQKKAGVHGAVAGDLRQWLHRRFPNIPEDFEGFMKEMFGAEPQFYREVTTEAFAWLKWLRQMASARHSQEA